MTTFIATMPPSSSRWMDASCSSTAGWSAWPSLSSVM